MTDSEQSSLLTACWPLIAKFMKISKILSRYVRALWFSFSPYACALNRLISAIWRKHSRMRCAEIVLAGLHEPTRVDLFFAAAYRGIMLSRRIALKSDARYAQFVRSVTAARTSVKLRNLHGPAHGFLRSCAALGISVDIEGDEIFLTMPTGTRIALSSLLSAYLATCRKEAAQHVILQHLADRVGDETGKHGYPRKDYRQVTPCLLWAP